jgi:hypothetical protein
MTDDRSLDMHPRAEFADRLEADLLREIGGRDTTTPTPQLDEEPLVNIELTPTEPSSRPRWMMFAAAAAVIALVIVGAALAGRGHNKDVQPADSLDATTTVLPASTHAVTFTVTWSMGEMLRECVIGNLGHRGCLNHFQMPAASTFEGDVAGQAYEGVFWNDPTTTDPSPNLRHEEFIVTYGVDGTVLGCGSGETGEFMLMEMMQLKGDPASFATHAPFTGTWQIVPASGRTNLATISGSGTSSGDMTYGDPIKRVRTFTGTVTCP